MFRLFNTITLCVFVLFLCKDCCSGASTQGNINAVELSALLDIYKYTNGSHWRWRSTSNGAVWNFSVADPNPCYPLWQGLTCSCIKTNCVITDIVLPAYRLKGRIPPSIGNFSDLIHLSLSKNQLNGTLPDTLGNLLLLQYMDVSNNFLRGTIPCSITKIKSLESFISSFNLHTGPLPSCFGSLTSLKHLTLEANILTGTIPDTIGQMTSLVVLDLGTNYLSGSIPDSIGNLTALEINSLADNHLNGTIPESICNLKSMRSWIWHINVLSGTIPSCIGGLSNLGYMVLYDNVLTGSLPNTTLLLNSTLIDLSMSSNQLSGTIPYNLLNTTNSSLITVFLNNNSFTGPLPEINLPKLLTLNLKNNSFSGTLSDSLCNSDVLANLDVSYNLIEGAIPANLGRMTKLSIVILGNNLFEGPLPEFDYHDDYSLRFNKTTLSVNNNLLTGTIPVSLCFNELTYIDLGSNSFQGTIPDCGEVEGFAMGFLKHFSVSANLLTGSIPTYLGNEWKLRSLTLNDNSLTGSLPKWNCTKTLEYLYLQNNRFGGSIALNANFSKIQYIDLSNNQLSGHLPQSFFSEHPPLISFAASSNCIDGSIPAAICSAAGLIYLDLEGLSTSSRCRTGLFPRVKAIKSFILPNQIQGGIPQCLFSMTSLQTLLLSGNSIKWSFPTDNSLVISDSLKWLSMTHNKLTGSIPMAIQNRQWENIHLSYNKLVGTVNFVAQNDSTTNMELEVNRLSGPIPSSLVGLKSINMLTGNLFQCDLHRTGLPVHDAAYGTYQCGSNSFNQASIVWVICASIMTVVGLTVVVFYSRFWSVVLDYCEKIRKEYVRCMREFKMEEHSSHLNDFKASLESMRDGMRVLTIVIVLIFLPLYGGLTHYYKTVEYQYAWTVSAAFLSGTTPAVFLFCVYLIFILTLFYCWYISDKGVSDHPHHHSACGDECKVKSNESSRGKYAQIGALMTVITVNCIIMVLVNAGFVLIILNCNTTVVLVAQIVTALFKLLWNDFAVKGMARLVRRLVSSVAQAAEEINVQEMPYLTFIVLFNSIIAPCLATAAVDSNCFYDVFITPETVTSQFPIFTEDISCDYSSLYSGNQHCTLNTVESDITVSYDPPFIYSYQCSSSILTNYASVYVFMFLMVAFLKPLGLLIVHRWYSQIMRGSCLHILIDTTMYRLLKAPNLNHVEEGRRLFHKDRFALRMIAKIAVLVTFGVIFPPLAVVVYVAFVVEIYLNLFLVGRFLSRITDENTRQRFRELLSRDCEGCMELLLVPIVRLVIPFAAIFYAIFVFDMYGDKVGYRQALWAPVVLSVTPICIWIVLNSVQALGHKQHIKGKESKDPSTEMTVVSEMHEYHKDPA